MPRVRVFDIIINGKISDVSVKMVLTPVQIKSMMELQRLIKMDGWSDINMNVWELDEDEAKAFEEEV